MASATLMLERVSVLWPGWKSRFLVDLRCVYGTRLSSSRKGGSLDMVPP